MDFKAKEKRYFAELKKIENKYYSIISNFNFNFQRPVNFEEQKSFFFKAIADDKFYNPKFVFEKRVFDEKKVAELKNLKIDTGNDLYGFKKLYKKRLKMKIYELETQMRWGSPSSTEFVKKYRGEPSIFLLSRAKNYCRKYRREKIKFKTLTPEVVAKRLKREVLALTGNVIDVLYVDIPSKVNISPFVNLVKVNPHQRFTSVDSRRLKVHEIGVHYMRYFNASKFKIKILESGTANYIETEEGLAVFAEEVKGVLSKAQMFIYAGRVIATYYALRGSFYEVYEILREYGFKEEDAFALTYRAKRNISDTSQKGGYTKDYVYFSGYLKVKKYAKRHNIKDLFIGKIRIEDLGMIRKFVKKNRDKIVTIFQE